MAYITADRIKETTAITGTGPATLTGAATGFRTFASVLAVGDTCAYAIVSATGSQWEVGIGTYSGVNTLTRTTVQASTNSNLVVAFTAGTKDVFLAPTAGSVAPYNPVTQSIPLDYIDIDQTADAAGAAGRLKWNDTDGTLDIGMKGGNVTQQVGQESYVRARNSTGSTLVDGMAVRLTGSIGSRATIELAQANSAATSTSVIGLLTEDIVNNQEGLVTTFGLVRNLNTTALTEGGLVYLSATVLGGVTSVAPNGPNHRIVVGICVRSHNNMGSILVGVSDAGELFGLSDVSITSPTDGQILKYDGTAQVWENASASVDLASQVTGILPILNGGTGVTTSTGTGSVVLSSTPTLVTPKTNNIAAVPVGSGAGNSLTIAAGSGVGTGAGGSLILQAGIQATSGGDGMIVVKQVAGQTSRLMEWRNSANSVVVNITQLGYIGCGNLFATSARIGTANPEGNIWVCSLNASSQGELILSAQGYIAFASVNGPADLRSYVDAFIYRDAANTLAQRRSTNPQSFRIYNTYTDASNYERLGITWATNICTLGLARAGTGSARNLVVAGANATTGAGGNVTIAAGNSSGVGAGGNIILQPGSQGSSGGNGAVILKSHLGTGTAGFYNDGIDANVIKLVAGTNLNMNGGSLSFPSTTTAISISQNDLALTASAFQRINCTSPSTITGIEYPAGGAHVDGRMIRIYNVGTTNLTLANDSVLSLTGNRLCTSTGLDVVLMPNQHAECIYDTTNNGRVGGGAGWRVSIAT